MPRHSLAGLTRTAGLTFCLMLVAAAPALAQRSHGGLTGQARTGDVVRVENSQTGFHRELTVDDSGRYRFAALQPGNYLVTVRHADGSQEPAKVIAVRLGTTTTVR